MFDLVPVYDVVDSSVLADVCPKTTCKTPVYLFDRTGNHGKRV